MNQGHNNPPSNIEFVNETEQALGKWLVEHPVILSEDEAREGKLLVDRAKTSLADMEDERDKKVRPLNEQVKTINEQYRAPKNSLNNTLNLLTERIHDFIRLEKKKREQEAEEARRKLEEAERVARQAEMAERDAKDSAASGVESDVAAATQEADQKFQQYEKNLAEVARKEKEAERVKIGGGFRRSLSIRTAEVLTVSDWKAAIQNMGMTEDLIEAILKSARAYRKATGNLPNGISSHREEVQ